jgi:hypothetical protein
MRMYLLINTRSLVVRTITEIGAVEYRYEYIMNMERAREDILAGPLGTLVPVNKDGTEFILIWE